MSQKEFEKESKVKLGARLIEPSAESWSKLSERLDSKTKQSKLNKKKHWWLGIAASLVGVLFVTQQFFYSNVINKSIDNTKVVEVDKGEDQKKEEVLIEKTTEIVLEQQQFSNKDTENADKKVKLVDPKSRKSSKHSNKVELNVVASKEQVADFQEAVVVTKDTVLTELEFENEKIKQVIAEIDVLKDSEGGITDAAIENLLLKAQIEIDIENSGVKEKETANAHLLLKSVEKDLDVSFRNKVFSALKENYSKVKTAIVQRREE